MINRWTVKPPPGWPIDWSHPLTSGLVVCMPFGDLGAWNLIDPSQRYAASGQETLAGSPWGCSVKQPTGQQYSGLDLSGLSATRWTICCAAASIDSGSDFYWLSQYTTQNCLRFRTGVAWYIYDNAFNAYTLGSPSVNAFTVPRVYGVSWNAGALLSCYDGRAVASGSLGTWVWGNNCRLSAGYWAGSWVWNRALSAAELQGFTANPWQIFAPMPWWHLPSSGSTYSFAPSGGLVAGGLASAFGSFVASPSGGLQAGGLASAFGDFVASPSGGLVGGGQATATTAYLASPSGGLVAGGLAIVPATLVYAPSGGLQAGGVAIVSVQVPTAESASFLAAVYSKLSTSSRLSDLVGGRIFPGKVPQSCRTWPAVVFQVISQQYDEDLDGLATTAETRLQLTVYSPIEAEAVAVAAAIRQDWLGFSGTVAGVQFDAVAWGGRYKRPLPPEDGSDAWTWQIATDFIIDHQATD